jgi:F-type H+-transporting ATPase subunit b
MKISGWVQRSALMAALALAFVPGSLAAADDAGGGGLFSVNPGLTIWTIVVFLVVFVTLKKFAWVPVLSALDARETGIRSSIDDATRMRDESAALLEEHRKAISEARKQSQEIVAEGRAAAERVAREIEEKAREEGDRLLERARSEIARERDSALAQLREESVELALAAASQLLRERLSDDKDRALVRGFLADLDAPSRVEA